LPQASVHIGSDRGKLYLNRGGFAGRGVNAECAADLETLPVVLDGHADNFFEQRFLNSTR
jgi:hypothetical protein